MNGKTGLPTSEMFFIPWRRLDLVVRETGWRNCFTGARSTVLQSPSFAVRSDSDANHFGNADDGFVGKRCDRRETSSPDTHAAQIISRLEIADAGPTSFLFFDQIAPRIGIWF